MHVGGKVSGRRAAAFVAPVSRQMYELCGKGTVVSFWLGHDERRKGSNSMMRNVQRAGLGLMVGTLFAALGAHAQAPAKKTAADPAMATLRQRA